jgi:hypothetical protein
VPAVRVGHAGSGRALHRAEVRARGAYDPDTPGPWQQTEAIKKGVTPYSPEFADYLAEVAQYVLDTYGKFPNTFTTMVLSGYVQAVHLDTGFYDTHYQPGAYLETHARHLERWHGDDAVD